jgi:hypothetical protein
MRYWSKRSSMLVDTLLSQMEANPPPPHTIGAHLLAIRDPATGEPHGSSTLDTPCSRLPFVAS